MKIKLTGTIDSMIRDIHYTSTHGTEKVVRISINLGGDVEGQTLEAKKAELSCQLILKPIVAERLKLGSKIQVVLTDDQ